MLEAVFNVAIPGLFVTFAWWWAVMEGLHNTLAQKQAERDDGALTTLIRWLGADGHNVGLDQLKAKAKEEHLAFRGLPDEPATLALSRERALAPLSSAVAVIAVCLMAEMGIEMGSFSKAGARGVSLVACWVGLFLEVVCVVMVARVGRDYRWAEALRSLRRP